MEAFESFVALALEAEDFVVAGPMKFMVKQKTKKTKLDEYQTHGYEVDLVAARADRLILASVKGFFGSGGVKPKEVITESELHSSSYKMLNKIDLRQELIQQAASKFGYRVDQVEMRLYAGKIRGGDKGLETLRSWGASQKAGSGPIGVFTGSQVAAVVLEIAKSKTYRDHEVLMAIKVLMAAGLIKADETVAVQATATESNTQGARTDSDLLQAVRMLPIGSKVVSAKDGLSGVVVGHKQDVGKTVYVRIWVDEAGKSHLRAASTLSLIR